MISTIKKGNMELHQTIIMIADVKIKTKIKNIVIIKTKVLIIQCPGRYKKKAKRMHVPEFYNLSS